MADTSIEVFVNEDVTGDAVAVMLLNAELVEVGGELQTVVELTPENAMRVAEALVDCAGRIVGGQ